MDHQTVYEAFEHTARTHPDLPFLCVPARSDRAWLPDGATFSYGQVLRDVQALRGHYARAGYHAGLRVATLLESRPEFFVHYLALNALGVSLVPVNPDYRHDELLYQMTHSDACLVVCLPDRIDALRRVAQARREAGGAALPVVDGLDRSSIANGGLPAAPTTTARGTDAAPGLETEASLLYTSGTTGRPKGCMLSNFYHLNAGDAYRSHGDLLAIGHGCERIYNPLPLYHMNAFAVTATGAILSANCLVLVERFSPARWWTEVVATGATVIHYLGIVAPTLLNQPPCPEERQHRVKFGLGAGIEPSLHREFEQRFGFPMVEVWGMTETGRIFADKTEPRAIDTRAFGRPYPGLEARVVDGEDRDVPRGQPGELLVRHTAARPRHGFFSGYLKNPEATEEAWRGGWFHTGDVVTQDATGLLVFVDRRKHIIRRSGENIAAAEVEAVLQAHDAVAQVAVVPAPDEVRDEEVFACVVPMPGHAPGEALARRLFDWANERLAYYKAPGWVLFMESLPTTGTQKVQKAQLFAAGEDPRRRAGVVDLRELKRRNS